MGDGEPQKIAGDSGVLTLDAEPGLRTLKDLTGTKSIPKARTRIFSVYAPDGSDTPGTGALAANTVTVFVGPNRSAGWPLAPGAWKDFDDVDPADMSFDSTGTSGQHVFFAYGGQKPEG